MLSGSTPPISTALLQRTLIRAVAVRATSRTLIIPVQHVRLVPTLTQELTHKSVPCVPWIRIVVPRLPSVLRVQRWEKEREHLRLDRIQPMIVLVRDFY